MFGIGGGTVLVPATSVGLAVPISIPGALGYVYAGWPAAVEYPQMTALQRHSRSAMFR